MKNIDAFLKTVKTVKGKSESADEQGSIELFLNALKTGFFNFSALADEELFCGLKYNAELGDAPYNIVRKYMKDNIGNKGTSLCSDASNYFRAKESQASGKLTHSSLALAFCLQIDDIIKQSSRESTKKSFCNGLAGVSKEVFLQNTNIRAFIDKMKAKKSAAAAPFPSGESYGVHDAAHGGGGSHFASVSPGFGAAVFPSAAFFGGTVHNTVTQETSWERPGDLKVETRAAAPIPPVASSMPLELSNEVDYGDGAGYGGDSGSINLLGYGNKRQGERSFGAPVMPQQVMQGGGAGAAAAGGEGSSFEGAPAADSFSKEGEYNFRSPHQRGNDYVRELAQDLEQETQMLVSVDEGANPYLRRDAGVLERMEGLQSAGDCQEYLQEVSKSPEKSRFLVDALKAMMVHKSLITSPVRMRGPSTHQAQPLTDQKFEELKSLCVASAQKMREAQAREGAAQQERYNIRRARITLDLIGFLRDKVGAAQLESEPAVRSQLDSLIEALNLDDPDSNPLELEPVLDEIDSMTVQENYKSIILGLKGKANDVRGELQRINESKPLQVRGSVGTPPRMQALSGASELSAAMGGQDGSLLFR
jgi:hypothetical protein